MLDSSRYTPESSYRARVQRRVTQWRCVKPLKVTPRRPVVSFTFDDFPRSAGETGARILEEAGARGTFYVSSSMTRQKNLMGDMYAPDDLVRLSAAGHEIAAHTHLHLDCSRVGPSQVVDEVRLNRDALSAFGVKAPASQFAWPYGETKYEAKKALASEVETARGIRPGINRKGADLMQLRAFELTPEPHRAEQARQALKEVAKRSGWVIIFTHDVRSDPSRFGTHPDVLAALVQQARESGAQILPVSEAMAQIRADLPVGAL